MEKQLSKFVNRKNEEGPNMEVELARVCALKMDLNLKSFSKIKTFLRLGSVDVVKGSLSVVRE